MLTAIRAWTLVALVFVLLLSACTVNDPVAVIATDVPTSTATLPPSATPTVTPTAGPTLTPTPVLNLSALPATVPATETMIPALGFVHVGANEQWQPMYRDFDGVEMVLVPAGCFTMGSESGGEDEYPSSRQCFDVPFWIDGTEVTNAQFGSEGYFTGPNRPRDTVSYPEAMAHCASRGARLPTEAEWEYAARGPNSWMYPWGNTFEHDFVVYTASANFETADVGSRPDGASWVGAVDMSGNLWEWTSSIYDEDYFPYPYDAADGRENPADTTSFRSIRGGSYDNGADLVRAISRKGKHPTQEWFGYVGFRCARSS